MDSKPRVMHVIDHSSSGGSQSQLVKHIAYLRDRYDFSVTVLGRTGRYSQEYRNLGIPVHELGGGKSRWNVGVIFSLLRLVYLEKPEIIHAHLFKSLILVPWVARITGKISILHDESALNLQSLHFYFPNWLVRLGFGCFYRLSIYLSSHLLTLTGFNKEDYILEFNVPGNKIDILPNSIDLNEAKDIDGKKGVDLREFLHLSNQTRIILMVGRLSLEKDWSTFLKVAAKFPDPEKYAFVVIGSGQMEVSLQEMASNMGLNNLNFLGERLDVPQLLSQGDLFMLTSRQEAFGIVILEAMAAGCPVIASRTPGARSIIQHGQTGLLVEIGDVEGFKESVKRIFTDRILAKKLVENAISSLEQYSSWKVSEKLGEIYTQLLQNRSQPSR